jgi:hypothetical protein
MRRCGSPGSTWQLLDGVIMVVTVSVNLLDVIVSFIELNTNSDYLLFSIEMFPSFLSFVKRRYLQSVSCVKVSPRSVLVDAQFQS